VSSFVHHGKRAALAALFSFFAAFACAQEVARPDVRVGDRWTYQRMDYDAGKSRGRYEMRVVFAERGVIQVVNTSQGKAEEVDATFTAEWNAVTSAGRVFNPHTGWFRFPLRIGDGWQSSFETILPKKQATSRNERSVKVVGWEEVVVPAGKFRALKVVADGGYQGLENTSRAGTARNTIWYVPAIKRWVKIINENRPSGRGAGEHFGEELVDYKLQ
jgi:hypothetical protein